MATDIDLGQLFLTINENGSATLSTTAETRKQMRTIKFVAANYDDEIEWKELSDISNSHVEVENGTYWYLLPDNYEIVAIFDNLREVDFQAYIENNRLNINKVERYFDNTIGTSYTITVNLKREEQQEETYHTITVKIIGNEENKIKIIYAVDRSETVLTGRGGELQVIDGATVSFTASSNSSTSYTFTWRTDNGYEYAIEENNQFFSIANVTSDIVIEVTFVENVITVENVQIIYNSNINSSCLIDNAPYTGLTLLQPGSEHIIAFDQVTDYRLATFSVDNVQSYSRIDEYSIKIVLYDQYHSGDKIIIKTEYVENEVVQQQCKIKISSTVFADEYNEQYGGMKDCGTEYVIPIKNVPQWEYVAFETREECNIVEQREGNNIRLKLTVPEIPSLLIYIKYKKTNEDQLIVSDQYDEKHYKFSIKYLGTEKELILNWNPKIHKYKKISSN